MNIILHEISGISVGLNKKDGYLNATKLCADYNHQKGTWLDLKVPSQEGIYTPPLLERI